MPGVSQIGRLRNKVTFKTTSLSADSYGGFTKANNSYFTAFAEIKPKVAQDRVQGDQQVSPQRFDVIIRYRSDKTALNTDYIMTFDSVDYNIVSIENPNYYDRYLKLVVEKDVAIWSLMLILKILKK
mgnify:CR=1 FL=1